MPLRGEEINDGDPPPEKDKTKHDKHQRQNDVHEALKNEIDALLPRKRIGFYVDFGVFHSKYGLVIGRWSVGFDDGSEEVTDVVHFVHVEGLGDLDDLVFDGIDGFLLFDVDLVVFGLLLMLAV